MQPIQRVSGVFILAGLTVAITTGASSRPDLTFRIAWATYLGGSEAEEAREVIPLRDGSVYVCCQTFSPDIPVTSGVIQEIYAGEPAGSGHPGQVGGDMHVALINAAGTDLLAATYFGGSKQERNVYGMALDRDGNVVISTATHSSDITTTAGVYQEDFGGGTADFVAAKLSPDLSRLIWCTYVGSTANDWARGGLALDDDDNVYLLGLTASKDFPTTPGVYQASPRGGGDGIVIKLTADASTLVFATRLGGSQGEDIMGARIAPDGTVHLAGHTRSPDFPTIAGAPQPRFAGGNADAYIAGLSADGSELLYSTFLGGSGNDFGEHCHLLLEDGSILFTGSTASPDFPTTPGAFQRTMHGPGSGFLTRLSADHTSFEFSTYLGGSGNEFYLMPVVDDRGNIHIVGSTSSRDYPVTSTALQSTYAGGSQDAVLAVLSPDGSELLYATYLGGSGHDLIRSIAIGDNGSVYLVGRTSSDDFPITPGAVQEDRGGKNDAFVVRLDSVSPR